MLFDSRLPRLLRVLFPAFLLGLSSAASAQDNGNDYVEGEVIVTFRESTSRRGAEEALQRRSLRFEKRFPHLSSRRQRQTGLVRNRSRSTQELVRTLGQDPAVETVEPNYIRRPLALPDDERFNELWALRNTGQTVNSRTGTAGADIRFPAAWEKARPEADSITPVIAILDTGVDYTHPELTPRMWVNTGEIPFNGIDDDGNGYVDDRYGYNFNEDHFSPQDISDHGTHLAGTIAALGNNSSGITGVMDRARIMALNVAYIDERTGEALMSTSAIIEAIEYAIMMKGRGVNVVAINASYGGPSFSTAERNAIQAAGTAGIILCAAAGNDSVNNDSSSSYPASYPLGNIITVAATDQNDALSSFSNYGASSVDLAAPGSNILSTMPISYQVRAGSLSMTGFPMLYAGYSTSLTGQVVDCGLGYPADFPPGISGKIALIARGTLTFEEKVANAQAAGAIGAVIFNNVAGAFGGTLGTPADWIPAISISRADGLALQAALPATATLDALPEYQFENGTSMATPHVSAAVAFAAMNFPDDIVSQRRQRILSSVDLLPALNGKVATGGRLNLDKIVDANQDGTPDWLPSDLLLTNASALKGGIAGVSYSETFTPAAGSAPFEFVISAGSLPSGMDLAKATGVLSGTPAAAGSYSFTVSVSDSNGASGSRGFTWTVAAEAPAIAHSGALPQGTQDVPMDLLLAASGGTPPYVWSLAAGSLPPGLSLTSTGSLRGIPTQTGISSFTLKITDSHQLTAEAGVSLNVITSPISIINGPSLPQGVRSEGYSLQLAAAGGTEPYRWTVYSGTLPDGYTLSEGGLLTGTTRSPGIYSFRVLVQDADDTATTRMLSLLVGTQYLPPALDAPALGSTHVGAEYTAALSAANYPKSFKVTGLPKGLVCQAKTGIISGRAKESGDFPLTIIASNPGGKSAPAAATLTVRPLPDSWLGNFNGFILPHESANGSLGGQFSLSVTRAGSYTLKATLATGTKAARGYLSESSPHLLAQVHGQELRLDFESGSQTVTGTLGDAQAEGWRLVWHARNQPATSYAGFYSAGAPPVNPADSTVPQGAGFYSVRVSTGGKATVAGQTATGDKVTGSIGLGPQGEGGQFRPLYRKLGSQLGLWQITAGAGQAPSGNQLSGTLWWLKPADGKRLYGQGFGPLELPLTGGYLAPKPAGSIIEGYPSDTVLSLLFAGGGVESAFPDPSMALSFAGRTSKTAPALSAENPARVKIKVNKASGLLSGSFVLQEPGSAVKRTVKFQGSFLPGQENNVRARGYFLLPGLPGPGQKAASMPQWSGGVELREP